MPSAGPSSSSLFDHLEALYPFARVLAGQDEAETLLVHVYEEAVACPPEERPEDVRGWLLALLLDQQAEETPHSGQAASGAPREPGPSDSFRESTAQQVVADALPVALAACSRQERFFLALTTVGDDGQAQKADLAEALQTTTVEIEQRYAGARAALQQHLQEVLSPPEQTLVQEALSDEALDQEIRTLLSRRFPRVPRSVRARVRSVIEGSHPAETSTASAHVLDDSEGSRTGKPWNLSLRSALVGLLILLVVAAVGIAVSHLNPVSSPTSDRPGLVAYSAQMTDAVRTELTTTDPQEAGSYVESTWNRRIVLPSLNATSLNGVGRLETEGGVDVPVLLYTAPNDSTEITVFVYSYALLDRMGNQAPLSTSLRNQLAARNEMRKVDGGVLWRNKDDIYVAVPSSTGGGSVQDWLQSQN